MVHTIQESYLPVGLWGQSSSLEDGLFRSLSGSGQMVRFSLNPFQVHPDHAQVKLSKQSSALLYQQTPWSLPRKAALPCY